MFDQKQQAEAVLATQGNAVDARSSVSSEQPSHVDSSQSTAAHGALKLPNGQRATHAANTKKAGGGAKSSPYIRKSAQHLILLIGKHACLWLTSGLIFF